MGTGFTKEAETKICRVVKKVLTEAPGQVGRPSPFSSTSQQRLAKITAKVGGGAYDAAEQLWSGTGTAALAGGLAWSAANDIGVLRELNGNTNVKVGAVVLAEIVGTATGGFQWVFFFPGVEVTTGGFTGKIPVVYQIYDDAGDITADIGFITVVNGVIDDGGIVTLLDPLISNVNSTIDFLPSIDVPEDVVTDSLLLGCPPLTIDPANRFFAMEITDLALTDGTTITNWPPFFPNADFTGPVFNTGISGGLGNPGATFAAPKVLSANIAFMPTGAKTLICCFKTSSGTVQTLLESVAREDTFAFDNGHQFFLQSSGALALNLCVEGTQEWSHESGSTTYNSGSVVVGAVSWDGRLTGGGIKWYQNGVLDGIDTATAVHTGNSGITLDLGALYQDAPTSTAPEAFDGVMYGMAVYGTELSAVDILCISNYYLERYRDT